MDLLEQRLIGKILCKMGYLTPSQLELGLAEQKAYDHRLLGQILLDLDFITPKQLDRALAVLDRTIAAEASLLKKT